MLDFKQSDTPPLGIHNDDNGFAFIQLKTFGVSLSRGWKGDVTNLSKAARDNPPTLTSRDSLVRGIGERRRKKNERPPNQRILKTCGELAK